MSWTHVHPTNLPSPPWGRLEDRTKILHLESTPTSFLWCSSILIILITAETKLDSCSIGSILVLPLIQLMLLDSWGLSLYCTSLGSFFSWIWDCLSPTAILTWFRILLLNQNRNAACGQYKEEILGQLRHLMKLEPNLNCENVDAKSLASFQSLVPQQNVQPGHMTIGFADDSEPIAFPAFEVIFFLLFFFLLESCKLILMLGTLLFFMFKYAVYVCFVFIRSSHLIYIAFFSSPLWSVQLESNKYFHGRSYCHEWLNDMLNYLAMKVHALWLYSPEMK